MQNIVNIAQSTLPIEMVFKISFYDFNVSFELSNISIGKILFVKNNNVKIVHQQFNQM